MRLAMQSSCTQRTTTKDTGLFVTQVSFAQSHRLCDSGMTGASYQKIASMTVLPQRQSHGCVGVWPIISSARDVSSIAFAIGCSLDTTTVRLFQASCCIINGDLQHCQTNTYQQSSLPRLALLSPPETEYTKLAARISPQHPQSAAMLSWKMKIAWHATFDNLHASVIYCEECPVHIYAWTCAWTRYLDSAWHCLGCLSLMDRSSVIVHR